LALEGGVSRKKSFNLDRDQNGGQQTGGSLLTNGSKKNGKSHDKDPSSDEFKSVDDVDKATARSNSNLKEDTSRNSTLKKKKSD
jgi:hypothetical protein